tara:strand:- start:2554 stop:2925 length:372 start_codon:yes stop_codon:yes gene_type:complete
MVKLKANYFSMVPKDSSTKVICFKERRKALHFKNYIIKYKHDFGIWPNLDFNYDNEMIKYEPQQNILSLEKKIIIEEEEFDRIIKTMKKGNLGLLLCYNFDVLKDPLCKNKITLHITGQEVDP